jgi:hypothetical protein
LKGCWFGTRSDVSRLCIREDEGVWEFPDGEMIYLERWW